MATARDLMRPCFKIHETTTVAEMIRMLSSEQEYCLAVVNANDHLTGIITETDLVRLVYGSGVYDTDVSVAGHGPVYLGMSPEQLRALTARDIMTNDPQAVMPSATIEELVRDMHRNRRKVILVAEDGGILGAIYRMDIVMKVLG